jgi:hypothetical protein
MTMRRFISILSCLMLSLVVQAQPGPDTLWTRFYGWTGDDTAFGIQQTADQGFIMAGTATVPVSPPHTDMFALKTDSLGQMQGWHSYGGPGNQGAYSVAIAREGGYLFTGYSTWTNGRTLAYFVRTDNLGDTLGTGLHTFDEDRNTWAWAAVEELADSYFAVSAFSRSLDNTEGSRQLLAVNQTGQIAGGSGYGAYRATARGVCTTRDSMVAVVGQVVDSAQGARRAYLWKTFGGNYFFSTYGGGAFEDEAYDVVETNDGFLLAGVTTDGHLDGTFLCKTTFNGDMVWLQRYVGEYAGMAKAVIPAIGGGFVVAGSFPTYWGDWDMYLAKFNSNGGREWQRNYGTSADEQAYDVVQTADGGFVLVGYSTAHVGVQAEWYIVKTLPDPQLSAPDAVTVLPLDYRINAFPNPFNPSTEILYDLPAPAHVSLRVFDLLGRQVAVLKDGFSEAGTHRVTFDGGGLPSGLYVARLEAGSFSQTRKLALVK